MQILYSPCVVFDNRKINYTFENDVITATYKDLTDTFDFSGFPNGVLNIVTIETDLEVQPILSAKRENGILHVELLNFIGEDATEEERFPEWMEVGVSDG